MRALVTGGGGFLGQEIVRQLLAQGWSVRSFSRGSYPELEKRGVECQQGDLGDPQAVLRACRDCDAVFHTAARAGVWGPWKLFYSANTLGGLNVLAACQQIGVPRLVYTSSPSVTFDGGDQCGVDESAPYPRRWLCHYPHTKALAEQAILAADQPGSTRTCSLRPHLIWGVGDPHLIPRLIARAGQGKLRQVGEGENLIDTIHVATAAAAHLLAEIALRGSAPAGGRAYFISQGEPVNCWRWINQILDLAGLPAARDPISFNAAWRGGWILEGVHRTLRLPGEPRMTRFLAAQLAKSHYYDIAAARRDLGFQPGVDLSHAKAELRAWLAGSR